MINHFRNMHIAAILSLVLIIFLAACQPAQPEASPTAVPATEVSQEPTQPAPTKEAPMTATEPVEIDEGVPESSPGSTVFTFTEGSKARFLVDEVLRGEDVTVVGSTSEVAGEITLEGDDLTTIKLSAVEVSADTLATDQSRRNQAIHNFILKTGDFPTIIFTPTEIVGLEGAAQVGETYTFQISGDLTIRDITHPVVFEVSVTASSPTELTGAAKTSIQRADYNLTIPSVPFVASVGEVVFIEIDITAKAQ